MSNLEVNSSFSTCIASCSAANFKYAFARLGYCYCMDKTGMKELTYTSDRDLCLKATQFYLDDRIFYQEISDTSKVSY